MKSEILLAAGLVVCATAAHAAPSDVNAQTFYASAVALEKKGMGAMFDKRLRPMMAQMQDAGKRVKAENDAAKGAGRPIYCVPDAAKKGRSPQEVLAMMGRVPEAERRGMSLYDLWKRTLVREYPCG